MADGKEKIQKYQKQYQKCYKLANQIQIKQKKKKRQIAPFVINNWLNQVYINIKYIIAKTNPSKKCALFCC